MPSLLRRELVGPSFIATLVLALNYPLVFQGRVLASLDSEAYFYPNAAYLATSLRAGRIPLWDPYIFAGVPFLANSQVGALYPPNLLYLFGPISAVASVLVVAHILLFAIGLYCLARISLGMSRFGATFAAAVAAGGGLIGGMVGHINQVEALAWAPFTILLVERGVYRSSWRLSACASIPMALAVYSGHTQVVYVTGIMAVLAGASRITQAARVSTLTARCVARQAGLLLTGPILAVLISGAQILPTAELTRASIRSTGLDFADAAAGSLPPPFVLTSLLPTVIQPPSSTEWIGYVSISALLLGAYGLWRARRAESLWILVVATVGLVLAFGQFTPIYGVAYSIVPGFRLFRVPARWLAVWVIGIALLAGYGAQAATTPGGTDVLDDAVRTDRVWRRLARWARSHTPTIAGLAVALLFGVLLTYRARHIVSWPTGITLGFWLMSTVGLVACLGLTKSTSAIRRVGMLVLLSGELAVAASVLPINEAIWPDAVESPRMTVTQLLSANSNDRVLALGDNTYDPGDLASIRARLDGTLPPTARDVYVTAIKHVEGLTPNLSLRYGLRTIDGYDGGILPLARYRDLKSLFAKEGPDVADGRLRIQLRSAPSPGLLSWLNVRWLLMDRLRDKWINGVYYDLGVAQPLAVDSPIALRSWRPFSATSFGVMLRGAGESPPAGELTLSVGSQSTTLRTLSQPGQSILTDPSVDPRGVWFWIVAFPGQISFVDTVMVSWNGDRGADLRALSAIDDRLGANDAIVVSPSLRFNQLGDMKIYENTDALPRAFLTNGLVVQPSIAAVVADMNRPDWQSRHDAVAVETDVSPSDSFQADGTADPARILVDDPERVVVEASATGRRLLVLTDSYYPGWRATVDGVDARIIAVDLLFRGVDLPPGKHIIEFTYQPITWRVGIFVTFLGIFGLIAIVGPLSKRAS